MAGLGAAESGVNYGVIGVIAIASTFVSVAPKLAGDVFGLRGACFVGCVFTASQPISSPAQKRVIRLVKAGIVLGFSWPRCLASHSSRILCLKAAKASVFG